MSELLGELNRIQHRPRPHVGSVPTEDYLNSRSLVSFDDETKLIRAQADRLMRYVYTQVPHREKYQPLGVLTTYDRYYTPPDDRYSSPKYLTYHRDVPSNVLNLSYYNEPSRVTIGRGHLACVSFAGGRGYPKRKHLYSDENRDIGDEIKFRSYYSKIVNPKRTAEALLLPTGFASRLLLTERNVYTPRDESKALLFTSPIKKASAASKERYKDKDKSNADKSKREYTRNTEYEPMVERTTVKHHYKEKENVHNVPEFKTESVTKKQRKQSKEDFPVETAVASIKSKSPEPVEDVEFSAEVVPESKEEPESKPEIPLEPVLPEEEPMKAYEPEPPKATFNDSKPEEQEIIHESMEESTNNEVTSNETAEEVPKHHEEEVTESAPPPAAEEENCNLPQEEPVDNKESTLETTETGPHVEEVQPEVELKEVQPEELAEQPTTEMQPCVEEEVSPQEPQDEVSVEPMNTEQSNPQFEEKTEDVLVTESQENESVATEESPKVDDSQAKPDEATNENVAADEMEPAEMLESQSLEEVTTQAVMSPEEEEEKLKVVETEMETQSEQVLEITEEPKSEVLDNPVTTNTLDDAEGTAENEPVIEEPPSPCENETVETN
ncbi:titin-like isoform X2 [Cimex lectularius]|nr:titin-like isoform X2 [Cimex lectularius]